ncbi:Ribonuclease H-like superfamily [Sesbania bispinosa]|nr:Ribonuclease H-like superfamily [Sesbania bispinosa]
MDCLDPALTLACASEYKDPFTLPILPHEKKRAAAVRSELASLYGGFGDQFAVIAAYECWQNSKKFGLEERFCTQYFVSQSSMHLLSVMRKQLATELFQMGLLRRLFQVVYDEITRDDWGMSISTVLLLDFFRYYCFSTEIADAPMKYCEDGNKFLSSPGDTFKRCSPSILAATKDALACVLSCDGLSGIRQTSGGANRPTAICKCNQFRQDSKRDSTGCVTAYQATENPCDRTSENALIGVENQSDPMTENTPIGSACIISTENTAKNQEEYRTELINHVAAMTTVPSEENVSASKCIENPSDPISQNTPRGAIKGRDWWTFPETGWIKANTDGSYKEDGCLLAVEEFFVMPKVIGASVLHKIWDPFFSGVISDEWKDGCKEHYVFLTELWGILTALNLAREKGISQLWIETDSTTSVEFISNTALQRLTLREGKPIADWLANYAHSTEVGLHVLDVPPPECITLLTEDVAGLYKYRRRACLEENCTSS